MSFVKPNAIRLDPRAQEDKDRELAERTSENLFHVQKQLVKHGHSIEEVIAVAAKNAFGINVTIHAPVDLQAVA